MTSNDAPMKIAVENQNMVKILEFGTILTKGAEAYLLQGQWFGKPALMKYRIPKQYRHPVIDEQIRQERTLSEARALITLKRALVPVPLLYDVNKRHCYLLMEYLEGTTLKEQLSSLTDNQIQQAFEHTGKYLARIHKAQYIHGDLTTSNIIRSPTGDISFIDFGLYYNSNSEEDRAIDLHLFKRVLTSSHGKHFDTSYSSFIRGYLYEFPEQGEKIVARIQAIELRGRYIAKEKRKKN